MNTDMSECASMARMLVEERGMADARKFAMTVRLEALSECCDAEAEQRWDDFGVFKAELDFWREVSREITLLGNK